MGFHIHKMRSPDAFPLRGWMCALDVLLKNQWQHKLDTNHGSKDEKRHVLEFVTQIHQLLPEHTEI